MYMNGGEQRKRETTSNFTENRRKCRIIKDGKKTSEEKEEKKDTMQCTIHHTLVVAFKRKRNKRRFRLSECGIKK